MTDETHSDAVDAILGQWHRERPDLDPWPMGIVGRLSRATRLVDLAVRRNLARFDLEHWEFDVLATLRRSGAPYRLTVGQLTASAMMSSSAITNRLDRMERRGLVTRELDPNNRRSVLVTLTADGLELVDRAVVAHVAGEAELLAGLSTGDRDRLADSLRGLLLALESDGS